MQEKRYVTLKANYFQENPKLKLQNINQNLMQHLSKYQNQNRNQQNVYAEYVHQNCINNF